MKRLTTRRSLILIAGVTILVVATIITLDAYYLNWRWTGFGPKTLWDWLDLLIIPIVLASGGLWFSRQEKRYEQQIAANRSHDEALQAYLDKMTELLLKEKLRTSTESDEVRSVARARTLTVLGRLDKERRIAVLQFLIESHLIEANNPIIRFTGSKLIRYDLSRANLSGANLSEANLSGANLSRADLSGANLSKANLSEANLIGADLSGADLSEAYLSKAYLTRADLSGANLSKAYLEGTNLSKAYLSRANLSGANLSRADLSRANLIEAYLEGAYLSGANLEGTNLEGTNLEETNPISTQHRPSKLDKNKTAELQNPTSGKPPHHSEI